MIHHTMMRIALGVIVAIAVLGVLRFKPWQRGAVEQGAQRQELRVGFLPVT
jgi:hypothetical protein